MPHSAQTINPNGPAIAATLDELLAHHDKAFIYCAYQTLLGRDPDEEGLRYYLARLRTGISKMHILSQIWRSEEARDYAAKLPRFGSVIRRYRWTQKPIIGWLVRPFSRVESNNATERKLRSLENQLFPLVEEDNLNLNLPVAASLDDLLAHQNQAFIFCAYRTLLGRDPDEEGLSYYLARLQTGISYMHILGQIWRSKEARDYAAKLPRIGSAIRRYRWAQKPIIGWLVRPFSRVESNNTTERKLRGLENQLFLLAENNNRCFDRIENAITELHPLVIDQKEHIKALVAAVEDMAQAPPIQPPDPEVLRQLSPRARDIYFQLKTAAAIHARRTA